MRAAPLAVAALAVGLLVPAEARACAVCSAGDPAITAPGAERAFARRLRLDVAALAGTVRAAAPGGRDLVLDDLRVAATGSWAPTDRALLSLVVPTLARKLHDGPVDRDRALSLGDVEGRVQYAAIGGFGDRTRLDLIAAAKGPTAPVQRDAVGEPLPTALQPGHSAVVPILGATASTGRGVFAVSATGLAELPFAVRDAPHGGATLRASAWLQVQPLARLATRFGARARVEQQGRLEGQAPDPSSGGFVGYATADVLARPFGDVVVTAGGAFPAVQLLAGRHRESAIASLAVGWDL